jgi:ferredoxin
LNSLRVIYFSPTGTTRSIVDAIARGLGGETIDRVDLTSVVDRGHFRNDTNSGLTIIGVPVYTGRVAYQAVEALQHMEGRGTPAVVVVVYGNRAYEDALLELIDLSRRTGFVPIAGAAFVGEHSFSNPVTPIAVGRPDSEDLAEAEGFGKIVRARVEAVATPKDFAPFRVPGNFPYRNREQRVASPETVMDLCIRCKRCQEVCPESAISVTEHGVISDQDYCILCCACVKNCPTGARRMDNQTLLGIAELLSTTCRERKSPEFFM